ncbi:MAG: hypothetical protein ACI870_000416 [Crocinitomicaceae bacterium]|jgi:hypothetical protein
MWVVESIPNRLYNGSMKKNHSSHIIFVYLGALLLLFILVFGIHYFQSQYTFEVVDTLDASQDYDDGKKLYNPFTTNIEKEISLDPYYRWVSFESETVTFKYPDIFSLQVFNSSYIKILPGKFNSYRENDCAEYLDEQRKALCSSPQYSPNITIEALVSEKELITLWQNNGRLVINNKDWQQKRYMDEFGGTTWYIHDDDYLFSYVYFEHADTSGGVTFDSLAENLGDQYQLSESEQQSLTEDILSTLRFK